MRLQISEVEFLAVDEASEAAFLLILSGLAHSIDLFNEER